MRETFALFPGGHLLSIRELEERLAFKYIHQLACETQQEQETIRLSGLEKQKRGDVKSEALELGELYHREILQGDIAHVSIHHINEQIGFGLVAQEEIDKGRYIGEYTGIVRKNDRRHFEPLNHFCYEYPVSDESGRSYVTDATNGNLTRFINHSHTPNIKPIHVFYQGFYHLIFLALHPIRAGSQLTYDYGQNYWLIRERPMRIDNEFPS